LRRACAGQRYGSGFAEFIPLTAAINSAGSKTVCRLPEIGDVSSRDRVHTSQAPRLLQHGILKICDPAPQGMFEYRTIDGGNLEQGKKPLQCAARLLRGKGLAEQIVNRRDRCCAEEALDLGLLNERKHLAGGIGKGLSVKQDIQNDIRVDQDPHEYFSRRCFL
jgi:hypothetical protein